MVASAPAPAPALSIADRVREHDADLALATAIDVVSGKTHPASVLDGDVMRMATRLVARSKIAPSIMVRVDRGDFVRAGGDAVCDVCACILFDHPPVNGYPWLRHACDGRLVKL